MKNYTRILIMMILSSLFIISSCKKEEEVIEGCPDSGAMNYNSNATVNDGSCIFSYDIAQGLWFFDFTCDSISGGISIDLIKEFLPNSVIVNGVASGELVFNLDTISISGTINKNGNLLIPEQTLFSFDTLLFGVPITVPINIDGDGNILSQNQGTLRLNYSTIDLFPVPGFPFTCEAILNREE
ncbi:MAG: hypothetical protein CBC83_01025 [Flavobacteriales bacterium TMED123]|nr:MAG: hypothetical protein CBC83_01025 [Flavobacteriales bacterium TMED123]|tara:strand:+ start:1827 stop:2378 length:552 start_codon:yes stop_codon:yes gene_type:complete